MKKIIIGLLSLFSVVAISAGTAYAAFSSSVTVSDVAFTTGTSGLQVSLDETNWTSSVDIGGPSHMVVQNAFPGYTSPATHIFFKNTSTSAINLKLSGQLTSATGDWNILKDVSTVSATNDRNSNNASFTLDQWNASARDMGITLAPSQEVGVSIVLSISPSADNTIAGKTLNTQWVITGTQTP